MPGLGPTTERPKDEGQKAQALDGGGQHHPAPIPTHSGYGQGSSKLHDSAGQDRHASHHAGHDRSQPKGQGKGGQIGLSAADHQAVSDRVGRAENKVAAEAAAWRKPEGEQWGPVTDSKAVGRFRVYTPAARSG